MEVKVNDKNFKREVLEANIPVLVDFWAQWCAPCLMIAPVVGEIAKDYQGRLKVCKLNVDEGRNTASQYGIRGIPTLMVFKAGNVEDTIIGLMPKEEIELRIKNYLE